MASSGLDVNRSRSLSLSVSWDSNLVLTERDCYTPRLNRLTPAALEDRLPVLPRLTTHR